MRIFRGVTKFFGTVDFGSTITTVVGVATGANTDASITTAATPVTQFVVKHVASAVNYIKTLGSVSLSPVEIQAIGTDTDIDLKLVPKGAGVVQLGAKSLTTTGAVNAANVAITDTLKLDTVSQALTATVALTAGAANVCTATITLKDMAGVTVTGVQKVEVFISNSATGIGLTSSSYSGAVAATTGTVLTALTAKKHLTAVTDANGVLVLTITDSGKPATEYVCVVRPMGSLVVSAASGTTWG